MLDAYELIQEEEIVDVHAHGSLLRHKKTGARIALLANEDDNKVFNIGFRTPPENSTGVAHIIEHTVLCGSRKFPLKDPFVELAKGSLNTFLNAMTYPDKTVFPVASCNDADFQNLMDVYLDAVFYPNIYKNELIFRQEGWHYHLEKAEDPLTYNGVVYNEMKGAFSSAEEVLDRSVFSALFPDTPYGVESGGDPACIPELTYEEFLDFHRKYYHPSNSYIYLYGNMNMEEKLDWLDREYLSHFEAAQVDSRVGIQAPFAQKKRLELEYPVLEDEPLEENTYLASSLVVGSSLDVTQSLAFSILEYVLLDAPGAPVKQALLDAGVGKDISGSYEDGVCQPFFTITAQNAEAEDAERFQKIIRETLLGLVEHGLDRKALASGINYFEFRFREADYSSYPKGLIYGLDMYDSWLYEDRAPFAYLKQLDVYETLKGHLEDDYFENLIRRYLLDNSHGALVILKPRRGLAAEREAALAARLAEYKKSLTEEDLQKMVEETKALKTYQEEEDSPEAIQSIPLLSRKDIGQKTPICLHTVSVEVPIPGQEEAAGTAGDSQRLSGEEKGKILFHEYETNGIGYLTLLFDTSRVPDDLIPYLGVLKSVLGYVDTEHYSYGELFHEINSCTGGISCGLQIFPVEGAQGGSLRMFGVKAKYLYPQQEFVFRMIKEILLTSRLDGEKRLREILDSQKVSLQSSLTAAGHQAAAQRALSYLSPVAGWQDRTTGITYYRLLEKLTGDFQAEKADLIQKLQSLTRLIFRPENLTVSLTAASEGQAGLIDQVDKLRSCLPTEAVQTGSFSWEPNQRNEGFRTSGQVQYVVTAGNFKKDGFPYSGTLRILRTILNYDYLWMNIRVKGGAYGCMGAFRRQGEAFLASYRDPHLRETLEIYRKLPEYLHNFQADEREMTKYIIGAISELDTPLNASAKGALALNAYFQGLTEEDFQQERDQILQAQAEDIRSLEDLAEALVEENNICVIGSEGAIERDKDLFKTTEALIRA